MRQEKSEAEGIVQPNVELIRSFYTSFGRRDARGMAACYHPAVTFSDEVFTDLHGARAVGMWQMLCERGKDLRVEFRDIEADDSSGRAHWEARYTFSPTGRQVHNRIDAHFEFRDGLIIRHRDRFNFWNWARQALGPTGWLLGWSGFVRKRVRSQAVRSLAAFMGESAQ
ncbi:MAG TPA: nuclear transport factor 2 family protein [Gemmatimonadaceae bacterium]